MKKQNAFFKIISAVFVVGILVSNLSISSLFALDEEVIWISTQVELETFAEEVNGGNNFKGQCIKLANDINLTADDQVDGKPISWQAIGYSNLGSNFFKKWLNNFNLNLNRNKSFEGTFDGNGYSINCNIANFDKINEKYIAGALFGCIGKNGVVKNLNISGNITSQDNSFALAGVCDDNFGLIENCKVRANIDGTVGASGICNCNYGKINDCSFNGRVTSKDFACAGIAGYNYSVIQNCTSVATIVNCVEKGLNGDNTFNNPESAGISSFNYGNVLNCTVNSHINNKNLDSNFDYDSYILNRENTSWNDGSAGGVASTNNGLIENCYVEGSINAYKLGGIAAKNYETIKDCTVNCKMTGAIVGGITAQNVAGDQRISHKLVFWKQGGNLSNCTVAGEINSFFLAGNIFCEDYWNDIHACVQDCTAENLSININNK